MTIRLDNVDDHIKGEGFGLFDSIFDEVDEAIAILAMDEQEECPLLVDVNKQFEIQTNYYKKDITGLDLFSLLKLKPQHSDTLAKNLPGNLNGNDLVTFPGELLCRDGDTHFVKCTIRPFSSDSSKGDFVCILRPDDQKTFNTSDILASRLLSSMSHDLRTPLNGIVGFSQIMMSEMLGPLGARQYRDYARDIYGASQDLMRLIDGFLDISQIMQGETFPLEESRIPVFDIISRAIDEASVKYGHAGISFQNNVPPDIPNITGDYDRLLNVLTIIFANAASRTPGQDKVDISARLRNDKEIEILCRDRGTPFSLKQLDSTFRLFQIEGDTYTSGFQASGISLPLAKIIVERHKGRIDVTNHATTGVVWVVCLPAGNIFKD